MSETDTTRAADHDSPWKMALESYFQEFLDLLFPAIHEQVDWSKGYSFLDKELQQITADANSGRRYADKLIKVYARDGSETWVLIHVEVQGEPEDAFAERMYTYQYRLRDRYGVDVVTLGDHVYRKREIIPTLEGSDRIVRPANLAARAAGRRWTVVPTKDGRCRVAVACVLGQMFMGNWNSPWEAIDRVMEEVPADVRVRVVDMHAEASSEKIASSMHRAEMRLPRGAVLTLLIRRMPSRTPRLRTALMT